MALLFECMGKCCRNMLDTADIVRDACSHQLRRLILHEANQLLRQPEDPVINSLRTQEEAERLIGDHCKKHSCPDIQSQRTSGHASSKVNSILIRGIDR